MATLASSASVTSLIADTTTTGAASRCAATIRATFSSAAASATDVPPNFMTIDIESSRQRTKKAGREWNTTDLFRDRKLVARAVVASPESSCRSTPPDFIQLLDDAVTVPRI